MKKVYKILISCAAGLLLFGTGVVTGGSIAENKNYSGTIVENAAVGSGDYDWMKYDVNIACNSPTDGNKYFTNNGDYIYNINYKFDEFYSKSYYKTYVNLKITYDQEFKFWDDLDTFMVLSNGVDTYTTEIETSHTDYDEDVINFGGGAGFLRKLKDYNITEIWVRTVD